MIRNNVAECSEPSCRKTFSIDNGGFQLRILDRNDTNKKVIVEIGRVNANYNSKEFHHVCGKECFHKEIARIVDELIPK